MSLSTRWFGVASLALLALLAPCCGGIVARDAFEGQAGAGADALLGGAGLGGADTGGMATGGFETGGAATGGLGGTGGWVPASGGVLWPETGGVVVATGGSGEGGVADDPCGPPDCNGFDCCESLLVPRGGFEMGRGSESCDTCNEGCPSWLICSPIEEPEHSVWVSDFRLDRFEVTVGRFRSFVAAFGAGWRPTRGAGANRALEGAAGLAAGTSGWQSEWDGQLPADEAALRTVLSCNAAFETWTDTTDRNETYPINCVNWYEAFAFCIWDGGRLPTAAEWEYAAAGGDENRLFPWGDMAPSPLPANHAFHLSSPYVSVGSEPSGNGRWGHSDLAGSMWEWALDWHADDWYGRVGDACVDCANLTAGTDRVIRGGEFLSDPNSLRAAFRFPMFDSYEFIESHYATAGIRCARDVGE